MFKKDFSNTAALMAIVSGIVLRFIWPEDMIWHVDQKIMFDFINNFNVSGQVPLVGMASGRGLPNPGVSAWSYLLLGKLAATPVGVVRLVMLANSAALIAVYLFIIKQVKKEQQTYWLLGLALAAVSPLPISYSRHLWAQNLYPIFSFPLLFGNLFRYKKSGAFLWGVFGALIGQLHMAGFFLAGGAFLWTLFYDYKLKQLNNTKWLFWLIGTVIGILFMVPWIMVAYDYVATAKGPPQFEAKEIIKFHFYFCWMLDIGGVFTKAYMDKAFYEFISLPKIGDLKTYLVALLHVLSSIVLIFILYTFIKKIIYFFKNKLSLINLTKDNSLLYLTVIGALGMGILITLAGVRFHMSYLNAIFPIHFIWAAYILRDKLKLMLLLIFCNLLISLSSLLFIHTTDNAYGGGESSAIYRLYGK